MESRRETFEGELKAVEGVERILKRDRSLTTPNRLWTEMERSGSGCQNGKKKRRIISSATT